MGRPNKLRDLESEFGNLEFIIPKVVNAGGGVKAAAVFFKVAESTISQWLKKHGYKLKIEYVKEQNKKS